MSLQSSIRAKLLTLLAPLTVAGGGPLVQIESVAMPSEAEVAQIIERFRDVTPAGLLSTPVVTIEEGQVGGQRIRVPNATLSYLFAAAFADRGPVADRLEAAEDLFDSFLEALLLQRPSRSGVQTTAPFDFIKVTDSGISDEAEMTIMFVRFQLTVRNLQVNSPA